MRHDVVSGVTQPNVLLIALTGGLITALLTKEYIVGMTDRRLIVLHFKGKDIRVQEVLAYWLHNGHPRGSKPRPAPSITYIEVEDSAEGNPPRSKPGLS